MWEAALGRHGLRNRGGFPSSGATPSCWDPLPLITPQTALLEGETAHQPEVQSLGSRF